MVQEFQVESFYQVFRSSSLSLRVLHITAIRIIAVLRSTLRIFLIGIEKYTMGKVSSMVIQKGNHGITAMF